ILSHSPFNREHLRIYCQLKNHSRWLFSGVYLLSHSITSQLLLQSPFNRQRCVCVAAPTSEPSCIAVHLYCLSSLSISFTARDIFANITQRFFYSVSCPQPTMSLMIS